MCYNERKVRISEEENMKKGLRLWSLLTIAFISTLFLITSLFYGLMVYQTAQSVRKTESKLLLSIGK